MATSHHSDDLTFVVEFNWKLTLSVLFVFPALLTLSFWQLDRAAEKKAITAAWQQQQASDPQLFEPENDYPAYQRIKMEGRFLVDKFWLRENQFHQGQIGYNVVMGLETTQGAIVAVDRGWVKGTARREFLPDISTPTGVLQVTGTLITPSDSKLIREAESRAKIWPHKILEVDLAVMGQQTDLKFYPKLLRIDPESDAAFIIKWRPINMSPSKHYGYAVQWALMALALIVLYVFASSNLGAWIKARREHRAE